MESLRVEYELTAADVTAGVEVLVRPGGKMMALRPWLLRVVWVLLAVSGALIVYVEASFWSRLMRLGAPLRAVPLWCQAAMLGFPPVWLALFAASWSLARDPDGALRWLRARIARKLLASRAPGRRTLIVTPAGVEVEIAGEKLQRPWTSVRRASRGEGHLVLDARDLWIIVPLHALKEGDRAALLAETSARVPIAAP